MSSNLPRERPSDQASDGRALRNALACFATGVCVVTTRSDKGVDVGLTVNSFTSISLDPPLVLWSLAKKSAALQVFQATPHFAIHVLAADQEGLSKRFASKSVDRFADLDYSRSALGMPLLARCAARFECRMTQQYEGGDHLIFVGEVLHYEARAAEPLVFHGGQYHEVAQLTTPLPQVEPQSPLATSDLSYLIWRAFMQFRRKYYEKRISMHWSESDSYILQMLAMNEGQTADTLDYALRFTGVRCTLEQVQVLVDRGLIAITPPLSSSTPLRLSDESSRMARELSRIARDAEVELLSQMPAADGRRLKNLLIGLIEKTAGPQRFCADGAGR